MIMEFAMSEQINEMNLPVISVPTIGTQSSYASDAVDSVVIGSPHHQHDPACVSVYAESISSSGAFDPACDVVSFDVVFSVGILEGNTSKTYRVVKRIGIDKCKIACEAECSSPITVVETKAEEKKAEAASVAKRFRILAGLE